MAMYDIAIVGGGVAGFFCAIQLLKNNKGTIIILEKNDRPLKKLLITGSGACNFTHSGTIDEYMNKYGDNAKFLKNAFYNFFVDDIVSFFENEGIKTLCRDDGKYFPSSMKASEIKDLFLHLTRNVKIMYNYQVSSVKKSIGGFTIASHDNTVQSKNVVIATGALSFPGTGSSGDGYTIAKSFKHTITRLKPSLANIKCVEHKLSAFSGISFQNAKLKHTINNKTSIYTGPLLLTHTGLSGPLIIDNSRYLEVGDSLSISFIGVNKELFESMIREKPLISINTFIKDMQIPKKMVQYFCEMNNIDIDKKIGEISLKSIRILASLLCEYKITVSEIEGFETCMCTNGGVCLNEVNPLSFESKLQKGLYFLGEVLDIDGDTGGYNLQAIWSECVLCAKKMQFNE